MGGSVSKTTLKVVVIGAGHAGRTVAQGLQGTCLVTLVEQNHTAFHNVAAMRAVARGGEYARTLMSPLHKVLDGTQGGSVVYGTVTSVKDGSVTLEDGTVLPYDFVVIATGSSYSAPSKAPSDVPSEVISYYDGLAAAIAKAKSVVVVGGGPVGIELAGEIAEVHPDVAVTLAHRNTRLLTGKWSQTKTGDVAEVSSAGAKTRLEALGVTVALNTSIVMPAAPAAPTADEGAGTAAEEGEVDVGGGKDDGEEEGKGEEGKDGEDEAAPASPFGSSVWQPEGGVVPTATGQLAGDVVVFCTGGRANTQWFAAEHPDLVDAGGFISVDAHMQVPGLPGVFAVGDCAGTGDQKLLYRAGIQAEEVVVPNVKALVVAKAEGKAAGDVALKSLSVNTAVAVLTFGSKSAMAHFSGSFGLCDCCAVGMKAGDLFRKEFYESTKASAVDGEDYRGDAAGWDLAPAGAAK